MHFLYVHLQNSTILIIEPLTLVTSSFIQQSKELLARITVNTVIFFTDVRYIGVIIGIAVDAGLAIVQNVVVDNMADYLTRRGIDGFRLRNCIIGIWWDWVWGLIEKKVLFRLDEAFIIPEN